MGGHPADLRARDPGSELSDGIAAFGRRSTYARSAHERREMANQIGNGAGGRVPLDAGHHNRCGSIRAEIG